MTELEIKILANKTYDSMVSQMRNIPGTTDKEIDIFMDKFTKNLREILIENNPEHGTELFKEEFDSVMNKCHNKDNLIYAFNKIVDQIGLVPHLNIKINENGKAEIYENSIENNKNIINNTDDNIHKAVFDRIEIEEIKQYATEPFKIEFSEAMNKIGSKNDLIYAFYEIANRINSTSDLDIKINEDGKAEIWQHYPCKEELFEKAMQNNAVNRLYKTIFNSAKTEKIKQNMILNVAYIIDCCILESYNTTHFALFDEIYHNILDVYFKQICRIELSRDDRRIIAKMILIILNGLNKELANRCFAIDGLFINNTIPEWASSLCDAVKSWTDIVRNDDDKYLNHIVESIENNIKDIMDKMKLFIPVFKELCNNDNILTTDNYINEFLNNAGYDIPATRIITINPCSFDYERKLGFLIAQLKNIMEDK